MNNLNLNCYTLIEYNFITGIFDKTIDATYIIHLENNGRIELVLKQLEEYKPTKKVYILYNKGYKKCYKKLSEYIPNLDLVDCNITIFNHSKQNNYKNILILEDDFFFDKKIKNKNIIDDINNFLIKNDNKNFIYYPGCIPIFSIPIEFNSYKSHFTGTAHSCIFSKKSINYILENQYKFLNKNSFLWDLELSSDNNIKKYHYTIPLCYQIFPVTDNQKNWNFVKNKKLNKVTSDIFIFLIKLIKIDKQAEPGFTIIYTFSKILFILFCLFFIFIFILFFIFLKKTENIKIKR